MRRAYSVSAGRCVELMEGLLDARELRVGRAAVVRSALTASRGRIDFADALIAALGAAAGCVRTVTFDQRAVRDGAMQLLGSGYRQSDSSR